MELHELLKSSYAAPARQKEILGKYGYQYDSMLSNHNQQIYFNPQTNQLLNTVTGTHNLSDWVTDANLAVGRLKDTNRYREAHSILRQAKKKYNVDSATIAGHSLGGSIAGYIGSRNDRVLTLDKGATFGQKMRANEYAYRSPGDVVSLLNANSKHMTTLSSQDNSVATNIAKSTALGVVSPFVGVAHGIRSAISSHDISRIKDHHIRV